MTICLFAVYRVCGSHNRRCMDSVLISWINDKISTLGTREILWHNLFIYLFIYRFVQCTGERTIIVTVAFFFTALIVILVAYGTIFHVARAHARGRGVSSFKKVLCYAIVVDGHRNSTTGPYCLYDHCHVCFFSIVPSAECQ